MKMDIQIVDKLCKSSGMVIKRAVGNGVAEVDAKERIKKIKGYQMQLKKLLVSPGVQQKTPEWYEMRKNMITASDFAQALGDGKFGTVKQFYQKKCEPCDESLASKSNPFFKWGNMFEPVAIDVYSHMFGVYVHEFGLIPHPSIKFFGASPDGISDLGIMVEIKCPKKRKITGEVPMQYFYQIQGQLDVCGLDECDYFESEFDLFHDPEDFWDNYGTTEQYQGIIIEKTDGTYLYHTINMPKSELKRWDATNGGCASVEVVTKYYWVLMKHNIQRVYRDVDFLKDKFAKLEVVWNNILRYRQDAEAYNKEILNPQTGTVIYIDTEPYEPSVAVEKTPIVRKYAFIDDE